MAYGSESSSMMPDKNLLDTCVSAFETAIREIRKIENGESTENADEPIILDNSTLRKMTGALSQYGRELYSLGYRNGRAETNPAEDVLTDEIGLTISDIINNAVYSDRRKRRGDEVG